MEVVKIAYLTENEFEKLGFDEVENFEKLRARAELAINMFIRNLYDFVDFEKELEYRKKAVKLATAFQIAYLDSSGIMTADEKQSVSSVSLGRTSISYKSTSKVSTEGSRHNLSLDALNALKGAGYGYKGVCYDRY
nr:MAG TPA: Putative Head Tail Connector Protein [Caudoviricetes sp.]